jgi:hypothetical protein
MFEGETVKCAGHEMDQYGRLIARCATDEVPDVGAELTAALGIPRQALGERNAARFGRLPNQGQHQRQGREDLSRAIVEALWQDENQHIEGRTLVLH